jgi:DNA polymerase-4
VHTEPWVPKGISREHTFQENLTDPAEVLRETERIAREVADDVAGRGRIARRVAVKVRFAPFVTVTRSVTLEASTADAQALAAGAARALGKLELDRPVRLLGVRAELEDLAEA